MVYCWNVCYSYLSINAKHRMQVLRNLLYSFDIGIIEHVTMHYKAPNILNLNGRYVVHLQNTKKAAYLYDCLCAKDRCHT